MKVSWLTRRSGVALAAWAAVITAVVIGGATLATATPPPSPTIGCVNKYTGTIRVIVGYPSTGCTWYESPIDLGGGSGSGPSGPEGPIGQTGPTGASGPAGATGASGPAGATGLAGADGEDGTQGAVYKLAEVHQIPANGSYEFFRSLQCDTDDEVLTSTYRFNTPFVPGDYVVDYSDDYTEIAGEYAVWLDTDLQVPNSLTIVSICVDLGFE